MRTAWVQELRDLLEFPSYEARVKAMQEWEARWTVELHNRQMITEQDMVQARANLLAHTAEFAKHDMGKRLADLMATTWVQEDTINGMVQVGCDVLAIRCVPQQLPDGD